MASKTQCSENPVRSNEDGNSKGAQPVVPLRVYIYIYIGQGSAQLGIGFCPLELSPQMASQMRITELRYHLYFP